jgi:hypothetical protein
LANNGGPTQIIAPELNSLPIDASDPEVCASPPVNGVDQRGYTRPGEGSTKCPIGAYEYDASELLLCDGDCNGDGEITVDEVITGSTWPSATFPCANACPATRTTTARSRSPS